jgi:hypothetical protein
MKTKPGFYPTASASSFEPANRDEGVEPILFRVVRNGVILFLLLFAALTLGAFCLFQ